MKLIVTTLLILFSSLVKAANMPPDDILDVIIKKNIIGGDSGPEFTKGFLAGCIKKQSPTRYKLECDAVLFTHYISYFEHVDDKSTIILITEDGASVENRWVFQFQGGEYIDIKNKVWPNITLKMISNLLVQQTGDKKYTESYVLSVAHSSYRVSHTATDALIVNSGIPDKSWGTRLGEIKWNGHKFKFVPKNS